MQNQGISEMLHLPQIISIFSLLPSGNEIHGVIQSLAWLPAFFVITSLHELHEEVEISKVLSSSSTFSKKGDQGDPHGSAHTRQEGCTAPHHKPQGNLHSFCCLVLSQVISDQTWFIYAKNVRKKT